MAATIVMAATAAPTVAAAAQAPVIYWRAPHRRRGMRNIGAKANTYSEPPLCNAIPPPPPSLPSPLFYLTCSCLSPQRLISFNLKLLAVLENVPKLKITRKKINCLVLILYV